MTDTALEWKRPIWYDTNEHREGLVPGVTRIWYLSGITNRWEWGTLHPDVPEVHYSMVCVRPDGTHGHASLRTYGANGRTITVRNAEGIFLNEHYGGAEPTVWAVDLDKRPADYQPERRMQRCGFCRQPTGEFCDPMFEPRRYSYCEGCRNLPDRHGNLTNVETNPATNIGPDNDEYYDPPDEEPDGPYAE